MPRIDKILYATDLSKNSAYAFRFATDIADKHNALIHVLNVLEELPESAKTVLKRYLSDDQYQKFRNRKEDLMDTIRERLSVFCDNVQKDDPQCVFRVASIDVIEGHSVNEILKYAESNNCDLIVMGTHGKGILTHALLGSVAEKVIRKSKIPVMVIPIPEEESEISYEI
jgi:nucleotide-binding universal stress UspA family protein